MLGNDVVLCIVGNKTDLEKDRQISVETAEEYAQSVNAKLYNTSAKLNKGIEELFIDLANRMIEKLPTTTNDTNTVRQTGIPIQSQSTTDQNGQTRSNSCC